MSRCCYSGKKSEQQDSLIYETQAEQILSIVCKTISVVLGIDVYPQ